MPQFIYKRVSFVTCGDTPSCCDGHFDRTILSNVTWARFKITIVMKGKQRNKLTGQSKQTPRHPTFTTPKPPPLPPTHRSPLRPVVDVVADVVLHRRRGTAGRHHEQVRLLRREEVSIIWQVDLLRLRLLEERHSHLLPFGSAK